MQKAIDGSARDLVPYEVPMGDTDISIDFMDAADLETIEGGLRRLDGGIALLALIQGLGILKIEREGLWMQGGFHTLQGYREAQGKRLGMPRQTISNRRKCAEGFEDNRKLLAKVPLEGNVSKLALLNEALQLHEKKEVLVHFKADSYQEFLSWIRPRRIAPGLPDVDLRIEGDIMLLDGDELLELSGALPDEEKAFVASTLRSAYRARAGNCLAHVVPVYDAGEARWVDTALKKHRAEK